MLDRSSRLRRCVTGPPEPTNLSTSFAWRCMVGRMPKRSSKLPDVYERTSAVVAQATSLVEDSGDRDAGKNPAAVELGRLGGKKGGLARARSLSAERRSEIARDAARTRWGEPRDHG